MEEMAVGTEVLCIPGSPGGDLRNFRRNQVLNGGNPGLPGLPGEPGEPGW